MNEWLLMYDWCVECSDGKKFFLFFYFLFLFLFLFWLIDDWWIETRGKISWQKTVAKTVAKSRGKNRGKISWQKPWPKSDPPTPHPPGGKNRGQNRGKNRGKISWQNLPSRLGYLLRRVQGSKSVRLIDPSIGFWWLNVCLKIPPSPQKVTVRQGGQKWWFLTFFEGFACLIDASIVKMAIFDDFWRFWDPPGRRVTFWWGPLSGVIHFEMYNFGFFGVFAIQDSFIYLFLGVKNREKPLFFLCGRPFFGHFSGFFDVFWPLSA